MDVHFHRCKLLFVRLNQFAGFNNLCLSSDTTATPFCRVMIIVPRVTHGSIISRAFFVSWDFTQRIMRSIVPNSAGSPEVNRDLSHRRAQAVKDSLVHMGVDPSRLTVTGFGEDYPLADNGTPEGRRINRRVEVHKLD